MDREVVGSVRWARENLTSSQMDSLGVILYDTLVSYLDLMTSDVSLDSLLEYATSVVEIGAAIKELYGYKMSANGKPLTVPFFDQNPQD